MDDFLTEMEIFEKIAWIGLHQACFPSCCDATG